MAAPPAAGVEAVAGAVGTVAALAAQTPGVEPLGGPALGALAPGNEFFFRIILSKATSLADEPAPKLP